MLQVQIIVTGKVQGVGYRYYTQMKAVQYGIHGWVRNQANNSVEMVAAGKRENLNQFIQDIKKGNPFSIIEEIEINEINTEETFHSFTIKY